MHSVLVSFVFEQTGFGAKVISTTNLTGEPDTVRPDHVTAVRVEVFQDFSTQLARVRLDVSMCVEMLLELVPQQDSLGPVLVSCVQSLV